jgi:Polyketide cyclase / dehydrase and lipid transport
VIDQTADTVWAAIRDFGDYTWAGVTGTCIENGQSGDAIGGIRRFELNGITARQRLLAHSDRDRAYTYAFCESAPIPLRDYVATIRITPVTDGNRAFVEWWATFDCAEDEIDQRKTFYEQPFHNWLESLRTHLSHTIAG